MLETNRRAEWLIGLKARIKAENNNQAERERARKGASERSLMTIISQIKHWNRKIFQLINFKYWKQKTDALGGACARQN